METLKKEPKKMKELEELFNRLNELIGRKDKKIMELQTKLEKKEEEYKELENLLDQQSGPDFEMLIPEELRTIRHTEAIKKIMGNIRYIPIDELEAMAEKYDHGCIAELPQIEFID
jgi:restriction endonuclease S subunit